MHLADLKARLSRLAALARGLTKDAGLWEHEGGLMRSPEQKAYQDGILDALAGIEASRAALASVIRRAECVFQRPR
jgi:hypothetical protein